MQNDIAILQTDLAKEPENSPHGIDLSDLQSFNSTTTDIPTYPLWTVGYSAQNEVLKGSAKWEDLKREENTATHELTRKFESDWGNAFHCAKSFDFHLWKYQEVLRQYAKKDTACKTLYNKVNDIATKADDSQPRFESMFMADHRALAVGSFEKIVEDPKDLRTEPRTRKIYHNMSGFYGYSGGMVCHFEGGDVLKPKVIGLCEESTLTLFLTR